MYVCLHTYTYVYIMHKELWEKMVTEMFLSERWISGNFYFSPQGTVLIFLLLFLVMNIFNLYQQEIQ